MEYELLITRVDNDSWSVGIELVQKNTGSCEEVKAKFCNFSPFKNFTVFDVKARAMKVVSCRHQTVTLDFTW